MLLSRVYNVLRSTLNCHIRIVGCKNETIKFYGFDQLHSIDWYLIKLQGAHQITYEAEYGTPSYTSIVSVFRGNSELFDGQEKENRCTHVGGYCWYYQKTSHNMPYVLMVA